MVIFDSENCADTPRNYETAREKLRPFLLVLGEELDTAHECLASMASGSSDYASADAESQVWHLVKRMQTVIRRASGPAAAEKDAQVNELEDVEDALRGFALVLEMAAARMKAMAHFAEGAWVEIESGPHGSAHGFIPPAYIDAFEKMFPSETDAKREVEPEVTTPPVAAAPPSTSTPSKPRAPSNGRKLLQAAT